MDLPSAQDPPTEAVVARALLDRRITALELARIAADRRWGGSRVIAARLFFHPNAPTPLRSRLLDSLRPAELVRAGASGALPPPLRLRAAALARARMEPLAASAKRALARRAGRPLLLDSHDAAVLEGLLDNDALREIEAVRIASGAATPPRTLVGLVRHARWGRRLEVRGAVTHNPGTPRAVALGLVARLPIRDLHLLAEDGKVAAAVRVAARERIEQAPLADAADRGGPRVS